MIPIDCSLRREKFLEGVQRQIQRNGGTSRLSEVELDYKNLDFCQHVGLKDGFLFHAFWCMSMLGVSSLQAIALIILGCLHWTLCI